MTTFGPFAMNATEPRAVVEDADFDEWRWLSEARVSEGHCAGCCARLRTLTSEEQAAAARWYSEPFAVCVECHAVHARPRPGQSGYPMVLSSITWGPDPSDPFRLRVSP